MPNPSQPSQPQVHPSTHTTAATPSATAAVVEEDDPDLLRTLDDYEANPERMCVVVTLRGTSHLLTDLKWKQRSDFLQARELSGGKTKDFVPCFIFARNLARIEYISGGERDPSLTGAENWRRKIKVEKKIEPQGVDLWDMLMLSMPCALILGFFVIGIKDLV